MRSTTIVYFRGGDDSPKNESDAELIAAAFIEPTLADEAEIAELPPDIERVTHPSVTVIVVIGEDYARRAADPLGA
jgi:hypothetical protein